MGLLTFGNDSFLLRPGATTLVENMYSCKNITGHDGPEPPHLARAAAFQNPLRGCTMSPTASPPTFEATEPTSSPFKTVAFKVGLSVALGAVLVCGWAVSRRMQHRQVHPQPAPSREIEMAAVAVTID